MRLIDAEVVKEFFRENLILPDKSHEKIVETMIDAVPTAYDIDKVVEELKKIETCGDCRNNCEYYDWSVGACEGHCEDYVRGRAIEIVKQGGVSDDVCEWKQDNMCETVYRVCGGCFTSAYQKDFKFCPYCGKKIKIVGD